MLRVGYNFDMGAGIMLTNTYTFQREDELKHGYNESKVGIRYLNQPIN
ncbi:outer membrane porin L [Escherichia coli]|uniref:Outer membrane porin L n=1 Tax=Escherichia coli TaxID=562 RepID=A0A377B5X0_ECOLX|nr:outer membrane porin L [Escherichia coli]